MPPCPHARSAQVESASGVHRRCGGVAASLLHIDDVVSIFFKIKVSIMGNVSNTEKTLEKAARLARLVL